MKIYVYNYNMTGTGGVVTFTKNIVKALGRYYDVTFLYNRANQSDLFKMSKWANVERYHPKKEYECDVMILASFWGETPRKKYVKCGKCIQVIHADLLNANFRYRKGDLVTTHVCVSENTQKSFKHLFPDEESVVIPNILDFETPIKEKKRNAILRLVTASRITKAKGFERMLRMAEMIQEPFEWLVYGKYDTRYGKDWVDNAPSCFKYMGYVNDVSKAMAQGDYLVQLSDSEGMPYSVLEAFQQRTPVIVTNFPSAKEIVNDGNGIIVEMDLSNFENYIVDGKLKRIEVEEYNENNIMNKWEEVLK